MWSKADIVAPRPDRDLLSPPEIVLDLSRLLSRLLHSTPTGVDRVEMAYARGLLSLVPDRVSFAARSALGYYGRLDRAAVLSFLDETEAMWDGSRPTGKFYLRLNAARKLLALMPQRAKALSGQNRVYLLASPSNLHKPDRIAGILIREEARFVCLVHDLIPIQFPEYARPEGADLHRKRMDTVGSLADGIIAYSRATADALTTYLADQPVVPPIRVAPLGANTRPIEAGHQLEGHPYFVYLGTIEPRKNHLLLLNIWRKMAESLKNTGTAPPKLVLIGRRGWENENVVDMLDRCPALDGHVIEASRLSDPEARQLLRHACALLFPSFAEGYGLPIAEALDMGVPVICSDIPAHREVGGKTPEYLDPLDGPAWLNAVKDYANPRSTRRSAQLERIAFWSRPSWDEHIKSVVEMCDWVANEPQIPR